jgi:hypothetical protein
MVQKLSCLSSLATAPSRLGPMKRPIISRQSRADVRLLTMVRWSNVFVTGTYGAHPEPFVRVVLCVLKQGLPRLPAASLFGDQLGYPI